ncbi:hypothetical protein [Rhizobium sp. BK602]|uniref:hypothetical protein n=1 Tax=Rhizobium sp. BK602 TaxID=2586986 RepID=UPI00160F1F6D|nr:hypothetical protein [Rhizobium sp. BK602]
MTAASFAMPLDHLGDRQGSATIGASPKEIEVKRSAPCCPAFSHRRHAITPQTIFAERSSLRHVVMNSIIDILINTNYVAINADVNMIYVNYFASVWSCGNPWAND